MTWAYGGFGSRTPDDVSIGKERFTFRRIAPPEMQQVETSDQAFEVAEGMLHKIMHHANERGIKVWLIIELDALPPNVARYCETVGSLPFFNLSGTFVHPLDETNREIQTNRLKALFDTYPEAKGYFLVVDGCLRVIPGRHQGPLLDHTLNGYFQGKITQPVDETEAVAAGGKAGTAIFMHSMTPHTSAPNQSPRPRRTLILSYRAAAAFPIDMRDTTAGIESNSRLVRGQEAVTANRPSVRGPTCCFSVSCSTSVPQHVGKQRLEF